MTQRSLREQIAAGQERLALIREQAETDRQQAERNKRMNRRTKYGDTVRQPHDVQSVRDALDDLFESAAEALDEVGKAVARRVQIERATADRLAERFPNITGGA